MSITVIIGIDEAGRGPLAGPVVAAAVHIPLIDPLPVHPSGGWRIPGGRCRIFDSKQLSKDEREASYEWITKHCPWGIGTVDADIIDAIGILEATNRAMQEAVAMLARTITPTYLLVDGRDTFWFDYVHSSVIEGDAKEPCIAAASIVAKVTRDGIMLQAHAEHPHYGFDGHKGYGTRTHIEAIKKNGPCAWHRRSYLKSILPSTAAGR